MRPMKWGNWTLHVEEGYLAHRVERDIELADCRTPAKMLDVIFQIHSKNWATPEDMAELLNALVDIVDPQRTLCSHGQDKSLSTEGMSKLIDSTSYRRELLDDFETGKFEEL